MKRTLFAWISLLLVSGALSATPCQEWKTTMLTADSLCESAEFDSAFALGAEALQIVIDEFGEDDTTTAKVLYKLGTYLAYSGDFPQAEAKFSKALTIAEARLPDDHPHVARFLNALGLIYNYQAKYAEAEPVYMRSLEIKKRSLGNDHPDVANSLENLALLHEAQDDYVQAEACHLEALRIRDLNFGEDGEEAAKSHNALGDVFRQLGDYDRAEKHFVKAKSIFGSSETADTLQLAYCETNIGNLYNERGMYDQAGSRYATALAILEGFLGPEHPHVATALNNLAMNYSQQGQYRNAEPLYERVITVLEKNLGTEHPDVAHAYSSLANLYQRLAKYDDARHLYEKALAIRENQLGEDHYDVATSCTDFGMMLLKIREYDQAEQLFARALAITGQSRGVRHPSYANCLENLARLKIARGGFSDADSILALATRTAEEVYGQDHPRVGVMMYLQADACARDAKFKKSDRLFYESIRILENSLGSEHPKVASCMESNSFSQRLQGMTGDAVSLARKAYDLRWGNFVRNSLVLPERDALTYSMFLRESANMYLSCYSDLGSEASQHSSEAACVISSSKGQVSDGILARTKHMSSQVDPELSALEQAYRRVKFDVSRMYVQLLGNDASSQDLDRLDSLVARCEELEKKMARYGAGENSGILCVKTVADTIVRFLPNSGLLVEYLKYKYIPLMSDTSVSHYLALILSTTDEPTVVHLGEAHEIDRLIDAYRAHMIQAASGDGSPDIFVMEDYAVIGRALYDKVWKPIEELASDKDIVLIAPDCGLNLVSFAGLLDDDGQFLIERHTIHYLSAGRDLVRLQDTPESGRGLLAIGDPDFNAAVSDRQAAGASLKSRSVSTADEMIFRSYRTGLGNLADLDVDPLPGTRREVEYIVESWRKSTDESVVTCLGAGANEERLKDLAAGNRVIHLATHGYFLEGVCQPDIPMAGGYVDLQQPSENPMLLTGLLLAGANLRGSGSELEDAEDGILTAYEVSDMDLTGTELVVLSACETGLGKVTDGEGVYGLRRAFQVAGARSVVSALWPVSDEMTAEMMGQLYADTDESLAVRMRQVQLRKIHELQESSLPDHPFSWGGFIAVGDWR